MHITHTHQRQRTFFPYIKTKTAQTYVCNKNLFIHRIIAVAISCRFVWRVPPSSIAQSERDRFNKCNLRHKKISSDRKIYKQIKVHKKRRFVFMIIIIKLIMFARNFFLDSFSRTFHRCFFCV